MAVSRFRGRSSPSRRRSGGGNRLRPVEWSRFISATATIVPSGLGELEMIPASIFEDYTRPTIVRILGELRILSGDLATGNFATGAWGISLFDVLEPPACPTAHGSGQRWMWWQGYHLLVPSQGAEPLSQLHLGVNYLRFPFDVRSMRKATSDGNRLALVIDSSAISSTPISVHVSYSVLIKE